MKLNFNGKYVNREEFIKELRSIATIGNCNAVVVMVNYQTGVSKVLPMLIDDLGNIQPEPSNSGFSIRDTMIFKGSDTDEHFGNIFDEAVRTVERYLPDECF